MAVKSPKYKPKVCARGVFRSQKPKDCYPPKTPVPELTPRPRQPTLLPPPRQLQKPLSSLFATPPLISPKSTSPHAFPRVGLIISIYKFLLPNLRHYLIIIQRTKYLGFVTISPWNIEVYILNLIRQRCHNSLCYNGSVLRLIIIT